MNWQNILHVSFQDPRHMTGGQGVSTLQLCRQELKHGFNVEYLSLRIRGEPEEERFKYYEGRLHVQRISLSDSDNLATPYQGTESDQIKRRMEFHGKALDAIREGYDPKDIVIHLHGFYCVPLLAGALPEYNTMSTYNLLLTPRMDRTGERDEAYEKIRALEILSFYANGKIRAISPGMKDEILCVARDRNNPSIEKMINYYANILGIGVALEENLEERIAIIPHGISEEFFEAPRFLTQPNKVVAWGRVSAEKGFEYLIEAASRLPNKEFLIFGTKGDEERSRRKYCLMLEDMAAKHSNVHLDFREGGVRGAELIKMIDSGEIIAMPSLYESFGLVNGEALARGKPVITTTTAGGKFIMGTEIPSQLPYGYVLANDGRLAEGIFSSLNSFFDSSEQERQAMRRAAFARAQNFKWPNVMDSILGFYNLNPKIITPRIKEEIAV